MSDVRRPVHRARSQGAGSGGSIANEQRLRQLGDAVERRHGGKPARRKHRGRRVFGYTSLALVVVIAVVLVGGYWYINHTLDKAKTLGKTPAVEQAVSGQPFNILEIGSDSRAGLSGKYKGLAGSNVSGQRSDVVKIMHVDPGHATISIVSIPRDTLVALLANQGLYGNYNRINVNYGNGPNLLVRTIEANFGIPINHVVEVSFGGLINATAALGGVYLNFPDPAKDLHSNLHQYKTGCVLINNFQALAVARSRYYEYKYQGFWYHDYSSDYGRIARQDAFIKALINRAKGVYNPLTILSLLNNLPQGIAIDNSWQSLEIARLAYHFRNFNTANMKTYMLPTLSAGNVAPIGDVLVVNQPAAQKLLVSVFGSELKRPTNPPPNANLQPNPPPNIPIPTSTTSTTTAHHKKHTVATTTTTTPLVRGPYSDYNPYPCTPK